MIPIKSCSVNGLKLIEHMCRISILNGCTDITATVDQITQKCFTINKDDDLNIEREVVILKIICLLISKQNVQPGVLKLISEEYFDKIFQKLLKTKTENLDCILISNPEISLYVNALNLISNLGKNASTTWFAKMVELFKIEQMHYVLGKAYKSNNVGELVCLNLKKTFCIMYQSHSHSIVYIANDKQFLKTTLLEFLRNVLRANMHM